MRQAQLHVSDTLAFYRLLMPVKKNTAYTDPSIGSSCSLSPLLTLWPVYAFLVGVRGLEPPTSASRTLRASRLRYTPIDFHASAHCTYPYELSTFGLFALEHSLGSSHKLGSSYSTHSLSIAHLSKF